jgi:hypothetical protein
MLDSPKNVCGVAGCTVASPDGLTYLASVMSSIAKDCHHSPGSTAIMPTIPKEIEP